MDLLADSDIQITWESTPSIKPYGRNARRHSQAQVGRIAESISQNGWTAPLLIDESNVILAGHGRLLAAQLLDLKQVPVIRIAGFSEAQKRAYRIADNKLAEDAEWDLRLLAQEVSEIEAMGYSVDLTGFAEGEIDDLLAPPESRPRSQPGDNELGPAAAVIKVTVDADERKSVIEALSMALDAMQIEYEIK